MGSNDPLMAPIRSWLAGPLDAEARRQIELMSALPDVRRVVVLPDAHAGARVCNGCVLATESLIYPDAVGRDIGCGYTTVRLRGPTEWCVDRAVLCEILHRLRASVRILRLASIDERVPEGQPDPEALSTPSLRSAARRDGRIQLATLGRGNHFVELQREEDGHVWLMVHSGSRGMGEAVYAHHTRVPATGRRNALVGLGRAGSEGQAYMNDAAWATRWASTNRRCILDIAAHAVGSLTGATADGPSLIDSPHNTLSIEDHEGKEWLIHRKSAARALCGETALIAGSASTFSVHAVGVGCEDALRSCAHGAGRAHRRADAARRFGPREVLRQYGDVVFDEALAGRLRDEAPGAYRDLRPVLKAQRDLARTVLRLVPLVSFKGV